MFQQFGWNAGDAFLKKLKGIMKDKTGNPDITFLQVRSCFNGIGSMFYNANV